MRLLRLPHCAAAVRPRARCVEGLLFPPRRFCSHTHPFPFRREQELPNNLSCDQDGFFVAGFERAGIFTDSQASGFPLSSALCCRPCFAADAPGDATQEAVAVVTTACVQSRWADGGQACPSDTFVMGYQNAVLGSPIERFYPVNQGAL